MLNQSISFGPFRLLPEQQLLLEDDKPVRLGSRAREILIALIGRAGQLVTKEELIANVWPDTHVEEANLRVHVAALRRALRDGHAGRRFVENIPGRGYSFVAPVEQETLTDRSSPNQIAAGRPDGLPLLAARVIGRDEIVRAISAQLQTRRMTTLVGPGGIGKTTVAVTVATGIAHAYPDGALFVDLAPIIDPALATSALAFLLGISIRTDNSLRGITAFLKNKRMLMVLDSCEHVIDAAANLSEQLLAEAPGLTILATSREPLRVRDERVQRLQPLAMPSESDGVKAAEALNHSAVELFVDRATECLDGFELNDANASLVCEICRRLDGIPLAIEFAASRVDSLGVKGIADHLNERFQLFTRGRRTAPARHQTLGATLDWSYDLLPERLRMVLRRLSIFVGWFTSEAAVSVVSFDDIAVTGIVACIADLISKSFVVADVEGPTAYYRLQDTTRAYALQKLNEAGEVQPTARAHAHYYCALFERAEAEWDKRPTLEWLAEYRRKVDNLRAALDWAFSPSGDKSVGVALTMAAVPLWFQLSLINECRERVELAIARRDAETSPDTRTEMKLHAALGWSLMYSTDQQRPTGAAWKTALRIAEDLDDVDFQLRALWGLWAGHYNNGDYRQALALAERFSALAPRSTDLADLYIAERMTAVALHFLGDQVGARSHIDRMLDRYTTPPNGSHIVRFQFEQRVTARTTLARVLWLQGYADQALRVIDTNIAEAVAIGHTLSLCNALGNSACPVALLAGDFAAADRYTAILVSQTEHHMLEIWRTFADVFRGELLARSGDLDTGLRLLRSAIFKLRNAGFTQHQTAFLRVLAETAARAGQFAEARAAINEALSQCERTDERWCMSELLRISGEINLLDAATGNAVLAEQQFLQSIEWARRQQALSWELRAATSLARLWHNNGRIADARSLLAPVYGRFTEGYESGDLKLAKSLLDQTA